MKNLFLSFVCLLALGTLQNSYAQKVVITNISGNDSTNVKCDTTTVRVGGLSVVVGQSVRRQETKNEHGGYIFIEEEPKTWVKLEKSKRPARFNGHWASFQIGVNGFGKTDYSMYEPVPDVPSEFMDLRQAASLEVNFNVLEWNIALNKRQNFGLVTGLGFSWNNYKFDNNVTIDKNSDGQIYPIEVTNDDFKKSKLMLCYLTAPLMVEYQFPVNNGRNKMFVSAGVVGGLNIKSLTKVKADNTKYKDKGSLAIQPFKGSGIVQIGGNNCSLYATFSFSKLFKDGRGPEMTPFSIGVSLLNLW
ncbi:MAG: outer membrane beta-barrel protein [Mangrovibacterium sp.]